MTVVNVFARHKAVKEGQQGVIQCQIWNVKRNDVISLTKIQNGKPQTLIYNGNLVVDKRRYFLTKYASKDGATYYVLKIKAAVKEDAGNYTFGVSRPVDGRLRTIAMDSVLLDVHYLPGPGNPICYPSGRLILTQGDTPELSCASEEGNPKVMLYWQIKETHKKMKSTMNTRNRVQTSTIKIEVTAEDNGLTFVCALYSHPYRTIASPNCTVGPIRVVNKTAIAPTTGTEFDTKFKPDSGIEGHIIVSVVLIAIIFSTVIISLFFVMVMMRRRRRLLHQNHKKRLAHKARGESSYDEVVHVVSDPHEKILKNDDPVFDNEGSGRDYYSTTISQPDGRNVKIAIHLNLTDTTCTAAISAENAAPTNEPPEYAVASVNVNTNNKEGGESYEDVNVDNSHGTIPNNDFVCCSDRKNLVQSSSTSEEDDGVEGDSGVVVGTPKLTHAHFVSGSTDIAYTIPSKQQPVNDDDDVPSPKLSVFFSSIDI